MKSNELPRKLAFLTVAGLVPATLLAERNYRALPALDVAVPAGPLPSLTIIVPARDEATNLPGLLETLCRAHYPGTLQIIVVDDGSSDGTADAARRFPVRLLQIESLPPGWTGKAYACHQGAKLAAGEWLLFVDADTRHDPHGPARVVSHALAHDLHGLSLFLPNTTSGATDRLALMVAFASFFAATPARRPVLNGQFILLRRDVYFRSGGFYAVRRQITEDLALGKRLRQHGYRLPIMRGDGAGTVQMYRHHSHLWQGLSRFSIASLRWTGLNGIWAILLTISVAAPVELVLTSLARGSVRAALVAWLAAAAGMSNWAARFGGRRWALLAPLGAVQVQLSALWGIIRRLRRRGVHWKGRDI